MHFTLIQSPLYLSEKPLAKSDVTPAINCEVVKSFKETCLNTDYRFMTFHFAIS